MSETARQLAIATPVFRLYPCAPAVVRRRLSGRSVTSDRCPVITFPRHLRKFIATPERITALDFAERYRIVTDGAHPGPWRREHAPHTAKILVIFGNPWTREIWYCGVDQSGKTITLTNCLAWSIEQLSGDIFYLMPSEETAKNIVDQKLRPMLEQSPHLRGYLSPRKDDTAITRIRLANGKTVRPSWASSALATATWSAQAYFCDEVDKFAFATSTSNGSGDEGGQGGKEKDPITAIRLRARTFRGREKGFFCSTPAGRFIRKGTEACHQVWEWRLLCPHCNELIRPEGEHLVLDDKATVDLVESDGVSLACHLCGGEIDELQRIQAIRGGSWVAIKGGDLTRPERVGFIHRAWDCLDVTLREIGVAWLKNLAGKLTDKIAWANGVEANDYQSEIKDRDEDSILRLKDESLPRRAVPADTSCLLLLVDTQKYDFRYQVWACGWGEDMTISVIDRGKVRGFDNLVDLAEKDWMDAAGDAYRVAAGWIDSGGGTDPYHPKHSRTREVYLFCKKHPLFSPLKGRRIQSLPWNITRLEYLPSRSGKKVPIPGGLNLYTLNVTLYKNDLATTLAGEPGDPGGFRIHADMGKDYAAQMCVEYQDDRGYWICPDGKENHDWDISVYGMAAIDIMGVRDWKPESIEPEVIPEQPAPKRRRW